MVHEVEKRKFERKAFHENYPLLYLVSRKEVISARVDLVDISASGLCFESERPYQKEDNLLILVNEPALDTMQENPQTFMKAGQYVMLKVVYHQKTEDGKYLVGCRFVPVDQESDDGEALVYQFTQLMNHFVLAFDEPQDSIKKNTLH